MSAMSNYLEDALAAHVLKNTAFTSPTETWVALFTAVADGEANSVTEVSGNDYVRMRVYKDQSAADAVSGTTPYWATVSNGSTNNARAIEFPVATPSGWGTVTAFGIYDAATTGNLLYYGNLTSSKTVAADDQLKFNSAQLVITLA